MDFFDKLGKKASEAYKVTADKTGKLAKETKLKFKMGELKSKIEDIYEEIGKKVYEKHVKKEEISTNDLLEECKQIDEISNEIEKIRQECLELKDKKQCQKCFKEIDKNKKEETTEEATDTQTNLEKTTEVEINPDPQNITEEEMKNIGQ